MRRAQVATRRSKAWKESYDAAGQRDPNESYTVWRAKRLTFAQDFISCFQGNKEFRAQFIQLMEATDEQLNLAEALEEARMVLKLHMRTDAEAEGFTEKRRELVAAVSLA